MKTKIASLLIATLSWLNVVGSNKVSFISVFKKKYIFYYYPKYKVYYCKENKKWYYPNGCSWAIAQTIPPHISLFEILFAEKERVISCSSIPFDHYNISHKQSVMMAQCKVLKPKIEWHTYYHSKKPANVKKQIKTTSIKQPCLLNTKIWLFD
ncbi:MAG: hypothetical protein IT234_05815 [Bacteroidia bacterium]|nr:hypothetical protein [Bacteroidia bacterium]